MTTEEAQACATTFHKMAADIVQFFHEKKDLHPPLTEILHLFAGQMTDLLSSKLPATRHEAARLLYLATIIGDYTVDEVAAAYIDIDAANNANTNTVAE